MPSQAVIDYYRKQGVAPRVADAVVELAARRVRIKRGGYAGDLATVTGRGMAGGVTVKTDSGVPLAFAATDLEAVEG